MTTFLVMAFVATIGFVLAHHLSLGHELRMLRSLSMTILSLYRMLLGEDAYQEMYDR